MKKIFKFSVIVSLCAVLVSLAGCQKEMNVDPMGENFSFNGLAPNPVMRGGVLKIFGRSLDQVTEVHFAGQDVVVTEFKELRKGAKLDTLELVVPLEGPEVGKVTIVAKDGRQLSSMSDLTFSESIEISSFSPATVLSGDVLTIKGEYLNVVKEIFFSGEDAVSVAFESQSRRELKVKVPANAVSGPVILSDVNEIEDQNTIPNHIYTPTELTVGDPTVNKAAKATYKSGDVITVTGEHLDMIKNVALPQVSDVEFTIAEDAKSITFNLPPKAADGNITLTSFAGKTFDAGEIETVSVTELTVKSLAEDARYKAGCEVEISGKDLDLVTKVEFTNAEATWYLKDGKIFATQPAAAKDGAITVTLDSGKQAYSDDIEVVKPVVTAIEKTEAVAGADSILVSGTDLDLVASVVIGTKEQSFIDSEFVFIEDEDKNVVVKVYIPEQAYSAPITLTAESGYETVTDNITITYDMAVAINFDSPSYGLGSNITVTGKNLLQIDQLYVKGKRVVDFAVRAKDSMSFAIPEGIGPGVYRLSMILMDGTELTWPVPFAITAPFTETFIWQGSQIINGWAGVTFGDDRFIWATLGAKVGDQVRIYYTAPEEGWWDLQLVNGCWDNLSLNELGGGNEIKQDAGFPGGSQIFTFEITEEVLACLNTDKGWGGAFIINGDGNVEITGISLIQFGAGPSENKNVIWEGSHQIDWAGGLGEANKAMTALSWGGYDWSTVEPGTILRISYDAVDGIEAQIRVSNGSWAAIPGTADPIKPEASPLEIELTQAMIDELVGNGGLVLTGQGMILTEVALVTAGGGPALPTGETIWEGSHQIDWAGGLGDANKAMTALSWGGYDWSTVTAGTTLVIEYDPVDGVEAQIRVSNGSWAALPGTDDPIKPEASPVEIELTQAMIDELVGNGGLVLTGQGMTLTAVILK